VLFFDGKSSKKVGPISKKVLFSKPKVRDEVKAGNSEIELLFGGEIILARTVGVNIDKFGIDYPFAAIAEIVRQSDLAFATLESPLLGEGKPCNPLLNCMVFVGKERYAQGIKNAGFDVLSLANNHIDDGFDKAILRTIDLFGQMGILTVGAGKNTREAYKGTIAQVNGIRVGFFACNEIGPVSYAVGENSAGSAWCETERIVKELADLRSVVDILVASFHWGDEYTEKPNKRQVELGRLAVDNGADIVVGDHPHWIQSFEVYRGKPIFYSVGNLVFDQMWSEKTRQGILVKTKYKNGKIEKVKIIPIKTMNFCCPAVLETDEKRIIIDELLVRSDKKSADWLRDKMEAD